MATTKKDIPVMTGKDAADLIRTRFLEHATELAAQQDPKAMMRSVIDKIEKQQREVILTMAGIDVSWGDVRARNEGLIAKFVDEESINLLKQWAHECMVEVLEKNKAKIKTTMRQKLQSSVNDTTNGYSDWWNQMVRDVVSNIADDVKADFLKEYRNENP